MMIDPLSDIVEYRCKANLNLYDSSDCQQLATQAATGRQLRVCRLDLENPRQAIQVELCEDDYPGWLAIADWDLIEPASTVYQSQRLGEADIQQRLSAVIAFTLEAMNTPNHYLWGGTVGPHYDCSGLIQAAFASQGIWLPRDAYQQEAFTHRISLDKSQLMLSCLKVGDLIFFGTSTKATHVGLYLGEGRYIHSSGREKGRNGIGIDVISDKGDIVSQGYYQQLRGAGRVVNGYQSGTKSIFALRR
ncbi:C40 family peptidase [Limnoraphis robusta]|uniref:Glycoside hydrolase n=1 Tax=Limnoraphis robusta CS-951 TaxID=1637645 RepID=A0A0J9EZX2_9CYAN|nr:glycoside hydrolase [Limnoraphis robusta CS-951]